MALVLKDRVKETTTTTGTGAITLAGAVTNFQTFTSVLSNADTTYYAIIDDTNGAFEVGLGTFASSGTTLTRTTILESSNSGSAVNLGTGTKQVFMTYPAEKSVFLNASNQIELTGGAISIKNTGSESRIDFYCEDNNQHYVRLQAPPHGNFSGNPTVVLPSTAGTIALTSDISAQDLDIQGDSGGALSIDLDSETLTITGGSGISTSGSSNTITIAGDNASTSSKGIASFASADFSVSSGAVSIKSGGVSNTQLAGSIADSKLSTISTADKVDIGALDIDGATDIGADLADADLIIVDDGANGTERKSAMSRVPTYVFSKVSGDATVASNGALTIASSSVENSMLAGSIANSKLANSSITVSDGSNTTATALGGTITFSGTSNEVDVAESSGTITIGLPNDVTIGQNLTVTGDLTVNGTTTTVNSTVTTVVDPILTIGSNSSDDNKDRGLEFKYNDGSARVGFFGYDDSASAFTVFTAATNSSEVFSGTTGNAIFNQITGTLQTAAQTNITSLGTLSGLSISGNVSIGGTTTQTGVSTSAAKDVFNAGMSVKNGSSGPGFIEFFEDSDHGGNFVKLQANANDQSYAADQTLTLPSTTGTIATTDDATALAIALG